MNKLILFAVTLLVYGCLSVSVFAGKLDKEVSDVQINPPQDPQVQLDKYFSCSCQCGSTRHNLPAFNEQAKFNAFS